MKRSGKKRRYDETMAAVVLILLAAGLVILCSTSAYNGRVKFHDEWYYLKKQGSLSRSGFSGWCWPPGSTTTVWWCLRCRDMRRRWRSRQRFSSSVMNITGPKDGCLWARFLFSRQSLPRWR